LVIFFLLAFCYATRRGFDCYSCTVISFLERKKEKKNNKNNPIHSSGALKTKFKTEPQQQQQ